METRIALLEQDARERRRILEDLTSNQRAQTETIHKMDKKIDQVLERKECPAIGLCVDLQPRIETLELENAERKGGTKMLAGLLAAAGLAGGAVSALVNFIIGQLHNRP